MITITSTSIDALGTSLDRAVVRALMNWNESVPIAPMAGDDVMSLRGLRAVDATCDAGAKGRRQRRDVRVVEVEVASHAQVVGESGDLGAGEVEVAPHAQVLGQHCDLGVGEV